MQTAREGAVTIVRSPQGRDLIGIQWIAATKVVKILDTNLPVRL